MPGKPDALIASWNLQDEQDTSQPITKPEQHVPLIQAKASTSPDSPVSLSIKACSPRCYLKYNWCTAQYVGQDAELNCLTKMGTFKKKMHDHAKSACTSSCCRVSYN